MKKASIWKCWGAFIEVKQDDFCMKTSTCLFRSVYPQMRQIVISIKSCHLIISGPHQWINLKSTIMADVARLIDAVSRFDCVQICEDERVCTDLRHISVSQKAGISPSRVYASVQCWSFENTYSDNSICHNAHYNYAAKIVPVINHLPQKSVDIISLTALAVKHG